MGQTQRPSNAVRKAFAHGVTRFFLEEADGRITQWSAMHADPVEHHPKPASAQASSARRFVAHVVQGHQLSRTRLDGLARGAVGTGVDGGARHVPPAPGSLTPGCTARRQGAEVVQQIEMPQPRITP